MTGPADVQYVDADHVRREELTAAIVGPSIHEATVRRSIPSSLPAPMRPSCFRMRSLQQFLGPIDVLLRGSPSSVMTPLTRFHQSLSLYNMYPFCTRLTIEVSSKGV